MVGVATLAAPGTRLRVVMVWTCLVAEGRVTRPAILRFMVVAGKTRWKSVVDCVYDVKSMSEEVDVCDYDLPL